MRHGNVEAKQNFSWTQLVTESYHTEQYISHFHLYTLAIWNIFMRKVPNMSFPCAFYSTNINSISSLNDVCSTLLNLAWCADQQLLNTAHNSCVSGTSVAYRGAEVQTPSRNSVDIGGVLDLMSKKNWHPNFLL